MDTSSKDIISSLPEDLICRILSFLPIEESALTSVLAKKWRYLFVFTPNLDFDGSVDQPLAERNEYGQRNYLCTFRGFVDRVLYLRGKHVVKRFYLKCGRCVYGYNVKDWILNVLDLGVSDLDLHVTQDEGSLPSKVFVTQSLTRLRLVSKNVYGIDVDDVYLPKLKTLYIEKLMLGQGEDCFDKITSGCPVLEELVLYDVYSNFWNRSVSSESLKRLTLWCMDYDKNPDTVSFDTPNVVYLKYSDFVAVKYPKVNFGLLVEADIDLAMTTDQSADANYEYLVSDVTDFLVGICNVQILYLSPNTLEVLTFCCNLIPVFNSLIHLTIKAQDEAGWESLPVLLKNCPNLETLIFEGLHHKYTIKCGDVDGCLCKYSGETPTCLSSSPVKVLKIPRLGESGIDSQTDLIKHFLESMPCLEQVIIHYDASVDEDVIEELRQFQTLTTIASPNCEIQVLSDNLS